ncbi:cysteine hydrolase [Pelomyxa schiedti]|nr:cysteine hydrolase [Pelomyxa schiedti]
MKRRLLLVIDVQGVYMHGGPIECTYPPNSMPNILRAMDAAREHGVPVAVVRHVDDKNAASPYFRTCPTSELCPEIKNRVAASTTSSSGTPNCWVFEKSRPGCFTGTNLREEMERRGVDTLTVCGYMTQMCCDTTTRQAFHMDPKIPVEFLSDATGSPAVTNAAGSATAEEATNSSGGGGCGGGVAKSRSHQTALVGPGPGGARRLGSSWGSSSSSSKSAASKSLASRVCGGKWSRSEVLAVAVTFLLASATMGCVAYACYAQFDTFYDLKASATASLLSHTRWSADLVTERAVVEFHAPIDALTIEYQKSLLKARTPPAIELQSYKWHNKSSWEVPFLCSDYDYGGSTVAFMTTAEITTADIEYYVWRTGATDDFVTTAKETWPELANIYGTFSNGFLRVYPYFDPISSGNLSPYIPILQMPYYAPATPANNPSGSRVWSQPYFDTFVNVWMVSLMKPMHSLTDGSFLGVCGIDILFDRLVSFVAEATADLPYNAYTMLVSKTGLVLALPEKACTDWMRDQDSCDYGEIVKESTYNASEWNIYTRADCADLVSFMGDQESGLYDSKSGLALSTDARLIFWSRINETGWVVLTVVDSSEFLSSQVRANHITISVVAIAGFVVVVAVMALAAFQGVRRQYGALSNKIEALQIEVQKKACESQTSLDQHLAKCDVLKGGSEKLLSILRALITKQQGPEETGVVVNDQGQVFMTEETLEVLATQIIPSLARGDIYRASDLRANEFVTDEMYKVAVACQVVSSEHGSASELTVPKSSSHPSSARTKPPSHSSSAKTLAEVDHKKGDIYDSSLLVELGHSISMWEFNVFDEFNKNSSLFELVFESTVVAAATDCTEELGSVEVPKLRKFGEFLHRGYNDSNPYHNSLHAMDVMQAVHWIMRLPCFISQFTNVERLSMAVAAAAHDYQHPGVNTDFLRNTLHPVFVQYNGMSPLESMHSSASLCAALGIGTHNGPDQCTTTGSGDSSVAWMSGIPLNYKQQLHKLVSQLILATDMSKHVEIFGAFKDMILATGETTGLGGVTSNVLVKDADKLLVMKMILKLADLGNTCRAWPVCLEWANRLLREFSQQAAAERSAGLTPFKLGDGSMTIDRVQVSFFPMFVFPVLSTLCGVFPDLRKVEQFARENYQSWLKMADSS